MDFDLKKLVKYFFIICFFLFFMPVISIGIETDEIDDQNTQEITLTLIDKESMIEDTKDSLPKTNESTSKKTLMLLGSMLILFVILGYYYRKVNKK